MNLHEEEYIEDPETVRRRKSRKRESAQSRKRRRKRHAVRFLVPLLALAVFFICVIAAVIHFGINTGDGIGSSTKMADKTTLFPDSGGGVGLIYNNSYSEIPVSERSGKLYLPMSFVLSELNSTFYYDEGESVLLYSMAGETLRWGPSDGAFIEENGEVMLSLDVVGEHTNLEYNYLEDEPKRLVLQSEWGDVTTAAIEKDTSLRVSGSAKSDIIEPLVTGERVRMVSSNDAFCEILTEDGFLGYVDTRRLEDFRQSDEKPGREIEEPDPPFIGYPGRVILGWHQVTNKQANAYLSDMISGRTSLNVLGPTWFSLSDEEGNIQDLSSAEYVSEAHALGIKVWAVVDNFNLPDRFEAVDGTYRLLSSTSRRQKLVEVLVADTLAAGADGINVDFEQLSGETGVHFAQFIRELSIASHNAGLTLSVDNYVPREYSRHYHREVQGRWCDYCVIMGYDEYTYGSPEAGPVASLDYVESGIDQTLADVPPERVINGIPFYARLWTATGGQLSSQALGMSEAAAFVSSHGLSVRWDDAVGCDYAEGSNGSSSYQIWLENEKSITARLSLMQAKSIAGAAFWRLGLDNTDVWTPIAAYAGS